MNESQAVVVVVDDEPPVLSALARLLRREPYDVLTTPNPHEALEWIRNGRVDLLITDQRMPVLSGAELVEATRRHAPETPCLLLTAYPAEASGDRLILKPWNDDDLKATIRRMLNLEESAESPSRDLEAIPIPVRGFRERIGWLECRDRTIDEALDVARSMLKISTLPPGELLLVLRDLDHLRGGVVDFLTQLFAIASASGVRTALVDPSGYAPALVDMCGPSESVTAYGPRASTTKRRILVVDDHGDSRGLLVDILRASGHVAVGAGTVRDAVALLSAALPNFMFLELALPDGRGIDIAERARFLGVPCTIIAASAGVEDGDEGAFRRLDIARRIAKPCRITDLLDAAGTGSPVSGG